MKRFLSLIMMIVIAETTAFAQSATEPRRWQFGAMVGPQFSMLVPKQEDVKNLTGIMAGLDVGYRFQDSRKGWSAHLQPYFSGFRSTGKSGGGDSDIYIELKSKMRSINAPLFVRYTFLGGKIRPFAELGANVVIHSTVSTKIISKVCPPGMACEVVGGEGRQDNINGNRINALASAGVQLDVGKVTIPITVRLIEKLKRETIDAFGEEYKFPKARVIQVMAGVTF